MKLSEYASVLPKLEKAHFTEKLVGNVDPNIDETFSCESLPVVGYTSTYDYLVCSSNDPSCDSKLANAFKSLDAFRTVFAEGWMNILRIKTWTSIVVVKGEVKPLQQSSILYKIWVTVEKKSGEVISGHYTYMARLSEVCNHVSALLYKCIHEVAQPQSCTSLPNQWLSVKKVVPPVPMKEVSFPYPKYIDHCKSVIQQPKSL